MASFVADRIFRKTELQFHELRDHIKSALQEFWLDKIAIVWTVEDIIDSFPHLTKEDAIEVLHKVHRDHDCEYGITREIVGATVRRMFPDKCHFHEDDEGERE
jgi:hypothetical protein